MTATDPLQADQQGPSDPSPRIGLAKEIHQSTRDGHANLIKLLAKRLPLAIPPQSSDPGAYATGMLHLAPVYAAFEDQWHRLLLTRTPDDRILDILQRIYLPGLTRAGRIQDDVRSMTGWSADTFGEQIHAVTEGHLARFVAHINTAVRTKPHVLIAYSYLLYIGLFEGGRLIRDTLENLSDAFWAAAPVAINPTMTPCSKDPTSASAQQPSPPPLSFLRFDTPREDDLRIEYETRLAEVQDRLTPRERSDIIEESHAVFASMALLIEQIDIITRSARQIQHVVSADEPQQEQASASLLGWLDRPTTPSARPRDSLLVAKERRSARDNKQQSGHSRAHEAKHSRRDERVAGQASAPNEPGRSVKFDQALPEPARRMGRGQRRRSSTAASDLKKSQGLFDIAVAVRLAGLM